MRRIRAMGIGARIGLLLALVSLGTLAVTGLSDFVLWPQVFDADEVTDANLLTLGLGFGGAVLVSVVTSAVIAGHVNRSVARLALAVRRVADGRDGVRVEPVALGREANELVAAFNEMAARIESTERSRRRLLTDLAHEIRTPISVLDGYLEGIQDGIVEPDAATVAMLRTQTTRLARLTADVQAVSRAEEGALNLRPESVDIADLVETAAAAARKAYADKGVSLDLRIAPAAHRTIRADRQRLEQVLANLLSNALRHSDSGGTVELGADVRHRRVRIRVVDHGDGIEPEHLPFLFERFYRTDVARGREGGGSGVGLTISKAIVSAHDGHLWVESDGAGHGATLALTLPLP